MNVYFFDPSLINIERLSCLLEILQVTLCYDITSTVSFYKEAHKYVPSLLRLAGERETQEEDVKHSVHSFLSPYDKPRFIDGCVSLDYIIKNVSLESVSGNPLYNLAHTKDPNILIFLSINSHFGLFLKYLRNIIERNLPSFNQRICYCWISSSFLYSTNVIGDEGNLWQRLVSTMKIKESYIDYRGQEQLRDVRMEYDPVLSYIHRLLVMNSGEKNKDISISEFFLREECYKEAIEQRVEAIERAEESDTDSYYYDDDRAFYDSEYNYIMNNGGDWIND